jgi:Subtilase family
MSGMTSGRAALAALTLAAVLGTTAALSAVRPHAKSAATPAAARGQLVVFGGRSAAQQLSGSGAKFDAALAALARNARAARPGVSVSDLRSLNPAARFAVSKTSGDSYVAIDAVTRGDPLALKTALVRLGLEHPSVYLNDVGGWLPLRSLNAAAALAGVNSLRAAMSRLNAGAVTSQGDYVQGSAALRSSAAVDGTGVTVGVLSDSFNCYATYAQDGIPASGVTGYASNGFTANEATDINTGDLPASSSINVLEEAGDGASGGGLCSYDATYDLPNGDEGRAMLQIVHDVAPGAKLAFYTAVNSEADMANGIRALANAGAKVIADDVTYFDEPFFQDGLLAQAVDAVNAAGVAYFSAAGNNGAIGYDNLAPKFATHSSSPAGELLMNFDTTGATTTTAMTATIPALPPGDFVAIVLEWDQPYVTGSPGSGGATSQLDLCFTGSGAGLIASPSNPDDPDGGANTTIGPNTQVCTGTNSTGVDPYQILVVGYPASATNGGTCPSDYGLPAGATCSASQNITIQVGLVGTTTPHRIKLVVEDNGAGVTYPGPIVPAGGTLQGHPGAAGAMAVGAAYWLDTPLCGTTPAQLEAYSARGGDPILFDATGAALATPVTRQKPDIVGPDGVSNTFLGFVEGAFGSGSCANTSYPNFFGTSAATPHVAATAALLLQKNPSTTPAQLYAALQKSAAPMSSSMPDYLNGFGFIQANAALSDVPAAPDVTLNLSPTTINVGDTASLTWTVSNATGCTASGAWSGSQGFSGSLTLKPGSAGSYSYTLTCVNANGKTVDTDVLTVVTPSSGGGGGALDLAMLLALGGLAGARLRRCART